MASIPVSDLPVRTYKTRRSEASSSSDLARAYFERQRALPVPDDPNLIDPNMDALNDDDAPDSADIRHAIAVLQRAGHEVRIRGVKDAQHVVSSSSRAEKPLIEIVAHQSLTTDKPRGPPKRKYSMLKRPSVEESSRRLSSVLLADPDDPDCKPYGCAYASCGEQSIDAATGLPVKARAAAFRTSSELLVHWKQTHEEEGDAALEKPYMCAMDGCFKDWKNLAGINYHIQVSNDHFQNRARRKAFLENGDEFEEDAPPPRRSKNRSERDAARKFHCPIPGCNKSYQQTAGLKYHLTSGKEHKDSEIGDWQHLVTQSQVDVVHP